MLILTVAAAAGQAILSEFDCPSCAASADNSPHKELDHRSPIVAYIADAQDVFGMEIAESGRNETLQDCY